MMSIEDKLAIHEVIAQYSYTYDGKDAEGFAQLFVDDGVFEVLFRGQTHRFDPTQIEGGDSQVGCPTIARAYWAIHQPSLSIRDSV
jgi:SnoaL-like domain